MWRGSTKGWNVFGLWSICRERYGQELCHSAVRQLWLEQSQSNRAKQCHAQPDSIVARGKSKWYKAECFSGLSHVWLQSFSVFERSAQMAIPSPLCWFARKPRATVVNLESETMMNMEQPRKNRQIPPCLVCRVELAFLVWNHWLLFFFFLGLLSLPRQLVRIQKT